MQMGAWNLEQHESLIRAVLSTEAVDKAVNNLFRGPSIPHKFVIFALWLKINHALFVI